MELTNFSARVELYTGSARMSRVSGRRRRGMSSFYLALLSGALGPLGAVFRAALFAIGHAGGIESAAHHVIAHSRQILHASSADQHNRMLLQIVPDAGNIGGHLDPIGQPDAR